ncbi:EAL domain-containing protein [Pleomorphomonas sp. JP5]|uniref:EAL domain-containing protein n=1 Tax=Pleomorphomonas sp. JP5 TaxID=2942998 RepID=UPI002044C3D3|nr:GGDEF domain-containing phosphodiesterase [Pleomorphomonas sp. JP5]MCM5556598.1 GGDEF domain-containing phosphodiesterase [Pleomorphomonas sp. JP5]
MDDDLVSSDGQRPASGGGIGAAMAAAGMAAYDHDYAEDRLRWSSNAGEVLDLPAYEVPLSGRSLHRLIGPQAETLRLAATPPPVLPEDRVGPDYRLVYDLMPRGGKPLGIRIEESGSWYGPAGQPAVGAHGVVRVLPRDTETAAPVRLYGPDRRLDRDELLQSLDDRLKLLETEGGSAVFLIIAVLDIGRINANFGYEAGDRVIDVAGGRILRRMRQGDVFGSFSGHKFGAILNDCDEHALIIAAERFRDAVRDEAIDCDGAAVRADVAIGAVMLPHHALSGAMAANRAEEALGDARRDVDRHLTLYEPSAARDALRRRNVEVAETIQRGLAEDRFVLAYQPIASAADRTIISYEALSRLVLPSEEIVSGGPYVEAAEKLGFIRRLDMRALTLVMADLQASPELRLSVNVSPETLADPAWLSMLVAGARRDGDALRRLTIEITETAALSRMDDLRHMVATVRDIGCRIAIDDFGSGHTSLRMLRDIKPDWLKIDGAFIRDIGHDADAVVFVRALTTLAGHFGIRTVAEFVQDEASATLLAELGITAFQGRLIGEPRLRAGPGTTVLDGLDDDGWLRGPVVVAPA